MSASPPSVMLIVDPRVAGVLDALARLRCEVSSERIAVQLRMKDATDADRISASRALSAVLPIDARLIVNGSLAVARAIAADGAHLPEDGGAVAAARAALASNALVGCSCHDARGAARRAGEGADYLVLGPLGEVPGKAPPMRAEDFAAIAREVAVPVLALGGIRTIDDVHHALALGARGVALQRALLASDAARLVRAVLEGAR